MQPDVFKNKFASPPMPVGLANLVGSALNRPFVSSHVGRPQAGISSPGENGWSSPPFNVMARLLLIRVWQAVPRRKETARSINAMVDKRVPSASFRPNEKRSRPTPFP